MKSTIKKIYDWYINVWYKTEKFSPVKARRQNVWHECKRPWTLYWLLQTQHHFPLVRVPGPLVGQPSGLLREIYSGLIDIGGELQNSTALLWFIFFFNLSACYFLLNYGNTKIILYCLKPTTYRKIDLMYNCIGNVNKYILKLLIYGNIFGSECYNVF